VDMLNSTRRRQLTRVCSGSRPSGEGEELSNGAQTTSVELTELPSQTRRLPPRFPSTGSTVSAYGLRGNKLLTTIHDPNYGQVRRRLTVDAPVYSRECATGPHIRGQTKTMNERREKVCSCVG